MELNEEKNWRNEVGKEFKIFRKQIWFGLNEEKNNPIIVVKTFNLRKMLFKRV